MKPGKVIIFGAGPIGIMIGFLSKFLYAKSVDFVEVNKFRQKSLEDLNICNQIYTGESLEENFSSIRESYDYVFTACSIFNTHKKGFKLLANGGY